MRYPLDIGHLTASVSVLVVLMSSRLLSLWSSAETVPGNIVMQGINSDVYSRPGDIDIGALMILSQDTDEFGCQKNTYPGSWNMEYSESVAFAVDLVNRDPHLLPNVTLGFHVVDDCTDRGVALSQALKFLPRDSATCSGNISFTLSSSLSSIYTEESLAHYDVIGILAPILSTSAVPVSYLLSYAKMPIVGYTTTTDELSDKGLHPYYLRVVTPDKHQALAMLELIAHYGWSYISVVYSQGPYGERAFDTIKGSAPSYKICIATSHRVNNDDDMDVVAKDLMEYPRARVVILFVDEVPARTLFTSIEKFNYTHQFIWICCDSITLASKEKLSQHLDNVVGAFMFTYFSTTVPEFYDYLRAQNATASPNPWFLPSYEDTANCSFAENTCDPSYDITSSVRFGFNTPPSLAMDAVLTFAHAAHNLISEECPDARGTDVRKCVKRDRLLQYLRNVTFEGFTGNIFFDENNDFKGRYIITQMAYDYFDIPLGNGQVTKSTEKGLTSKTVFYYDTFEDVLTNTNESVAWDHLIERERIVSIISDTPNPEVPESVCSRPCKNDEYKIQKELECCWECRRCRENERLVRQATGCQACPEFTWPDPLTNFATCSPIPVTYPSVSDTLPVIQICLGVVAIICTFFVIGAYFYYRHTRVMKAASRELSVLQLGGIFVGYITVICFQTTPTASMCTALYFMFCLSFAWLYSPLLIKAIRIYRIFQSGSKNNRRPRFVSPRSQVILSSLIIISQIILCLAMYIIYHPTAKKTQPVLTENFVELSCDMTLPGLCSFLAYNIILVSLCSVFAFKTRKLPDNFNESKFISMCVYTTLVIWLAFVPTYFTASREFVKVLLLSVALLVNHTVALVFLFLPKIYATMFVAPENLITNRIPTGGTGQNQSGSSNRVVPTTVAGGDNPPRPGF